MPIIPFVISLSLYQVETDMTILDNRIVCYYYSGWLMDTEQIQVLTERVTEVKRGADCRRYIKHLEVFFLNALCHGTWGDQFHKKQLCEINYGQYGQYGCIVNYGSRLVSFKFTKHWQVYLTTKLHDYYNNFDYQN